ncbi:hypothetical protein D3C72_1642530 [compost metagenome]
MIASLQRQTEVPEEGGDILPGKLVQICRTDFEMRNRPRLRRAAKRAQPIMQMHHEFRTFRLLQRNPLHDDRKCRIAEHEAAGRAGPAQQTVFGIADFPRQPGPEKIAPVLALAGGDIGNIDDFDENESMRNGRLLPHRCFYVVFEGAPVGQAGQ